MIKRKKNPKKVARQARRIRHDNRLRNVTEMQFNQTEAQRQILIKALSDDLKDLPGKIQEKVDKIRTLITSLDTERLLMQCFGHELVSSLGKEAEVEYGYDDNLKKWIKEYVFNVLASTSPASNAKDCGEKEYQELAKEIGDLQKLLYHYILSRTAQQAANPQAERMDRVDAEMRWLWVRGKRYLNHEQEYLSKMLSPQNNMLVAQFGVTVEEVLRGVDKLSHALTYGMIDSYNEIREMQRNFFEWLDGADSSVSALSPPERFLAYQDQSGTKETDEVSLENFYHSRLIDATQTGWNEEFLRALSWESGEASNFFDEPYPGWPVKALPSLQRPFLKVDGRTFAFDLYILLDNLYRSIERALLSKAPELRQDWNTGQKLASEQFTGDIFNSLLPTSVKLRGLFYKAKSRATNKMEWCEIDEVKPCGDHLVLIETKAGSSKNFTPFLNYEGRVDVLRSLIYEPFTQAQRLLAELDSKGSIELFILSNGEYNYSHTLTRSDYRTVTLCGVSIDNITEAASKRSDLTRLGIDPDQYPVWAVSVDDLLVFRDTFKSPLIFLHFLEERIRASRSNILESADEIDHAAAYLTHINYVSRAEAAGEGGIISWFGYQSIFDKYYALKDRFPEAAVLPRPSLPSFITDALDLMWTEKGYGLNRVVSHLLSLQFDETVNYDYQFAEALSIEQSKSHLTPIHIGTGHGVTLFAAPPNLIERYTAEDLRASVLGVMRARGESTRLVLKIVLSEDWKRFEKITTEFVTLGSSRINRVAEEESIAFRKRQLMKRLSGSTKIGRNDPCSCGSGKKYKRCCELILGS